MPEEPVRCLSCGKVIVTTLRAADGTRQVAIPAGAAWRDGDRGVDCCDICMACVARIDDRFRRANPSGRGTLAEVLLGHYETFKAALRESLDSDLREVLPDLPLEQLPRRRKWRREMGPIEAILRRLRKPVCWYDPVLARRGEGPFWLFHFHTESGGICHAKIDYFDVVELGDFVNALDYSPDGTPIPRARNLIPGASLFRRNRS